MAVIKCSSCSYPCSYLCDNGRAFGCGKLRYLYINVSGYRVYVVVPVFREKVVVSIVPQFIVVEKKSSCLYDENDMCFEADSTQTPKSEPTFVLDQRRGV